MLANQPKNDTLYIKGFNIVVENRAFTYRQVAQNVGQKVCLMPAHYGYLQNNPKVGVFVGAFPENDTVYLINQKAQGGYFDKHIAMFGFLSEQQAVDTYQKCFEYGYIGLMSVVPCTIEQLKWWLANGDNSRPVTKERLPYAGLERLDSVLWGGEDKADLASHSGQVSKLLYQIRQSDNFNHALEPLSYHDLTQELGNQGFVYENYDALVIEYNKLERKAKQLLMAMQGAADIVKPVGVAVSKPLTKGGVANVVAWFEMEDGQAVGVFFHNPDKTPKKIDPTDEMISYKWVLNKKDITIVVAPENGKDLVVRTVAKRIMKLVDANHDRFLKANGAKAELNLREQDLNAQVIDKQAELDALNKAIEALEAQKAEKEAIQAQSDKPYSEKIIDALVANHGWTLSTPTSATKEFAGMAESGEMSDGTRMLTASFDSRGRYIGINKDGWSNDPIPETDMDMRNYMGSPLSGAREFNDAVEAYVAKQRELVNPPKSNPVRVVLTDKDVAEMPYEQHTELDARIDSLSPNELGYLGVILNYKTSDKQKIANDAKQEHPDDLKTALESLDKTMAQEAVRKKIAEIGKQPNRDDALALAVKFTKEMPSEAERIRTELYLAIAQNKWRGIEVKLPQQPPKLKTDAEVLASVKRLQKSFDGTEFRLNISKANTDFIRGTLIKGSGSSMSSQEFSYFNNKGFDLGYIEYGNQFDFDTFNPILKGIEKWLQGDIIPKFYVGTDVNWDMDSISTPLKIKEALDKALSEGLAMQQPSEPEPTPTTSEPVQPVSEPQLSSSDTRRLLIKNFSELAKKAGADSVVDGLAQGYAQAYFFDASTKKTSVVELDISANVLPPSGEAWVFEKHSKIEVSDGKNNVIATFSPTKENILKAFDAANEYMSKQGSQPESEPPKSNPDRDYLQSIIDGKDTGLEPKAITAKIRTIISTAKDGNDTDMLSLADQAAKAYAAQVKAKAAAKLAEVQ